MDSKRAVELLTNSPELVNNKTGLWGKAIGGNKAHNSQLDVVIDLFKDNLLNIK